MPPTASIQEAGGLIIAVNSSIPNMPRLLTVKVVHVNLDNPAIDATLQQHACCVATRARPGRLVATLPGPTRAPGTPSSINNINYTNGTAHRVSWGSSNGYGHSVKYKLQERKDNGSWQQIYEGYSRSKSLANKSKGRYQFRVQGCNSKGCSSFKYGSKMLINPNVESNLYTKYPVLHDIDQYLTSYHSDGKSFKTDKKRLKPTGQGISARTTSEERFYLGDGYDLVRGALKETCLDPNHNDFVITETAPLQPSEFDIEYINDNRELAEMLDVSSAGQVGFSYDDITLGLSSEKDRYTSSVTNETFEQFVVKWVKRDEFWKLNTPTDAIIGDLVTDILNPNDDEAKADFRERCGDNYVNAANLGAALYLVVTFDAKSYSFEERVSKRGEVSAILDDILSLGGAQSMTTEQREFIRSIRLKVKGHQVGGPEGLAATINAENFDVKYNQFIQGTDEDNWAVVDFQTNEYQRPTAYSSYPHDAIFADYSASLAQMRRWADISVQLRERCDAFTAYGKTSAAGQCGQAEANLMVAMDHCRKTREWEYCGHPAYYQTGVFTTLYPGVNLLNWFSDNVKILVEDDVFKTYSHSGNKKTINDNTCLPSAQCFANKFRGSGAGINKGFVVNVTNYDNRGGDHPRYTLINGDQCVNTSAYLKKNWFANPTPKFHYNIKFEGLCAETQHFVVIQ